jgi:hypothetical protein
VAPGPALLFRRLHHHGRRRPCGRDTLRYASSGCQ